MQPIQFFAARAEDGALLPNATVDVFLTGTLTRATLFSDAAGTTSQANPLYADGVGRVFFYTSADRIDIRVSRSGYVAPLIEDLLVTDPADILALTVAQVGLAEAQVNLAAGEVAKAEAARDSTVLEAKIAEDIAAGLAATTDAGTENRHFKIFSPDAEESFIYYRHDAGGVATEMKRYPSAAPIELLKIDTAESAANIAQIRYQTGPYRSSQVDMDGEEPLATFAVRDLAGQLFNLLAFMPDGSLRSRALDRFILDRLGGAVLREAEAADWGGYVFAQRGVDGLLYAVSGIRADGTQYPGSGGAADKQDILHIPLLGQSNMAADDSKPALSTSATGWGSYMFSRGVATWSSSDNPTAPEDRTDTGFSLVDLTAGSVETRANALADAFKARVVGASRFSAVKPGDGPRPLVSFSGLGGRKLTELGPEDDGASGRVGARTPGGHWPTMLDDIARGKAAAAAQGAAYSVPGWIYDQGESEGDLTLYHAGDVLTPAQIISGYAEKALFMAQEFDSAVRAITGQVRPIPLFVTPATYNTLTPTAWMNVADSSPLVFIVGARYQMPSARNASNGLTGASQNWGSEIHYSPDGHRWIGEMCAKVMHRVLNEGEDWQPLRVLSATKVDATHIDVTFHVPRPPLVVDVGFLPKAIGWGFSLVNGVDARVFPTSLSIQADGRTVRMEVSSVPVGASLSVSQSTCDITGQVVDSVGVGPATEHSFPTYTVKIAGDVTGVLGSLNQEGAFWLAAGDGSAMGVIRNVSFDGTHTVLTGEDRELRTGGSYGPFAAGDALIYRRMNPYTNIRDSDNAMALNTFASGPRAGKLYPLQNWACVQEGLDIKGA
ncbi:MAG: hypothetical protein JKY26_17400 [Pseudomonas sp.]|nr:hypothetical protein [Pseudomonas sp.]